MHAHNAPMRGAFHHSPAPFPGMRPMHAHAPQYPRIETRHNAPACHFENKDTQFECQKRYKTAFCCISATLWAKNDRFCN
jgi:hypothetical protein